MLEMQSEEYRNRSAVAYETIKVTKTITTTQADWDRALSAAGDLPMDMYTSEMMVKYKAQFMVMANFVRAIKEG